MERTVAVSGLELFVRDSGNGEPLLVLHGFTGSGDDWQHVFSAPPAGFRVIAPDLRAHGRSTNPSGTFTFADVARDIGALLDALAIPRVKAIGMSGGANALLHLASTRPGLVEAMVLVSTTPRYPDQARAIMRSMPPDGLGRFAHQFAEDRDDMNFTAGTLSRITARTLIVHGDRDPLYPVELAVELYRGIPHATLWVVPNGGHGPIFGEQAAPFVHTAQEFLRNS
jgi:pimeloyl-ACP methyl ester carboxylesterase